MSEESALAKTRLIFRDYGESFRDEFVSTGVAAGLAWKANVRAATTAAIAALAGGAPNTIDGVTLAANDRILVKNQAAGSQNGIYYVATLGTGSNGTWTRATDADTSAEVTSGIATRVNEGTVNDDTAWVLTTNDPITLGVTALVFSQFVGQTFYDLSQTNVDVDTVTVALDGVVAAPASYTLDARNGTLTFDTPPDDGVIITVTGLGGMFTIDQDMGAFIDIAFDLHAKGRNPSLDWDTVSPSEEYAIALLAIREALWAEIAEHAHQVDVTTPEGMHIPGGQQFNQLMAMLEKVEAHYREFASVLNVGPWAIEMFTLRRVSRTTNRLVPIYVPQEFDDHSTPVRVYPPINPGF